MAWNIPLPCQNCSAIYDIEAWDLGHKESDQLMCQCCGHVIRSWKNEARSYSISRMVREGTFKVCHQDWEKYVGKSLRFTKGDEIITGKMIGLDLDYTFATSLTTIANPWLIEMETDYYSIFPEDEWNVRLI